MLVRIKVQCHPVGAVVGLERDRVGSNTDPPRPRHGEPFLTPLYLEAQRKRRGPLRLRAHVLFLSTTLMSFLYLTRLGNQAC